MTQDDELLAHGRLLKEYSDLSKRLPTLKNEGRTMATLLSAYDSELSGTPAGSKRVVLGIGGVVEVTYPGNAHLNAFGPWPSLEKVTALVGDLADTKKRLDELTKELKALGLPISESR